MLAATMLVAACGGDDGLDDGGKAAVPDQDQDATTASIDSTYEYQLPVIFHVLYQDKDDAAQYVPATRLKSMLQYVNEIYQGDIYGPSENVRLKFVLAETDEKGQKLATPGVEYVCYDGEYPIDASAFMVDKANVKYIWDPNEYINVMLYPFKEADEGELLGISHMPYTIKGGDALEGLETVDQKYIAKAQLGYPLCSSVNSSYAGQSASGAYYQSDRYTKASHEASYINSADIVVTLAHELGHYLGLFHVFTDGKGQGDDADTFAAADSCADTDYCADTPSYNRSEYNTYLATYLQAAASSPSLREVLRRQACDGTTFTSTNIMDYAYTLGYQLTAQQKARVRHVLYYSPLIPGPKRNGANTRSTQSTRTGEDGGKLYTHPRLIR